MVVFSLKLFFNAANYCLYIQKVNSEGGGGKQSLYKRLVRTWSCWKLPVRCGFAGKKRQLNRVMSKVGELTGLSLTMTNTSHLGKMVSLREYDSLPLNTLLGERTWGPAVQVVPEQERLFFS